jgi:K+-sensing histidine kinase KdpD
MKKKTHFAPALRSSDEEILMEFKLVGSQKFFTGIFGAVAGIAGVINKNRQILYANDDFLALLGINSLEPILGRRPGEVISCIHAEEEPFGCGTSVACSYCGAVNAIMESQKTGLKSSKETSVSTMIDGKLKSWDLNITSSPITIAGQEFYLLNLQDISSEKRRLALEKIFFHDLLNSAGGLHTLLTLIKDGSDPEKMKELISMSEQTSRDILDEIILQSKLTAAENGDLIVKIEKVNSIEFLTSTIQKITSHETGKNKRVVIAEPFSDLIFETDKILFLRIMINLLKNALESTPENGLVISGVEDSDDRIRFWVKNDTVMSQEIQMQLFQRSFSTKDKSRGLGTYSVKLLTENYLKGKVSFISNEKDGTIFSVELNKVFPSDSADHSR